MSDCLAAFLQERGFHVSTYYDIDFFKRLLGYASVKQRYSRLAWYGYRLLNFFRDRKLVRQLKTYDLLIIAETSPKCYLTDEYDFVKGKRVLGNIPMVYHGVYYLGNAPTIEEMFKKEGHNNASIFDWHLVVSSVTEIRSNPTPPWNQIGMYLRHTGLKPARKARTFAVVDFEREGREHIRNEQIQVLTNLGIPFVALSGTMSIAEIREIYRQATYYFIQFPESFGVPIAECLSCGAYIFMPDSSWAMAWRLDENPEIHGPGTLADCFVVYEGVEDLQSRLAQIEVAYDLTETPREVFSIFLANYRSYYEGNQQEFEKFTTYLESNILTK
ncbi:hypothetical protein [Lunatimonas sp.]|uniref:hypothetical protein n=1 Tax=Lunatimonas sp. TaxID=2060141 RepID=UPI00263A6B7B|nr:hypothetical protein [Lunatimonas sp.]